MKPGGSRQKGKRGEREAAAIVRAWGTSAQRAQQHKGTPTSEDLEHGISGVSIEVKSRAQGHPGKWLDEQLATCTPGSIPMVLHKRPRQPWLVTLYAVQLPSLARRIVRELGPEGA